MIVNIFRKCCNSEVIPPPDNLNSQQLQKVIVIIISIMGVSKAVNIDFHANLQIIKSVKDFKYF